MNRYILASFVLATFALGKPVVPEASHSKICSTEASYSYGDFHFSSMTEVRYATPVASPVKYSKYASGFQQLSTLIPGKPTYTTYKYVASPTATKDANDKYGQSAYRALWGTTTYKNQPPFTTTRAPTPVASSELVLPPKLYSSCPTSDSCLDCFKFPKDFISGVASSAWQIEGGLMEEGRGPSLLDIFGLIPGTEDANVADMQYYLYKQDILRIAAMGITHYSFSIAWSRVMPFGFDNTPINQQAIDHYTALIDFCLSHGVTPIVTLNHADVPAVFGGPKGPLGFAPQGYGHPKFVDSFLYYAKVVMTRFADRVPIWFTFNEANSNSDTFQGYKNVLMAHAKTAHFYKKDLKGTGKISLKFASNLAFPLHQSSHSDIQAALRYNRYTLGILGNPLFLGENFPGEVLSTNGTGLTPLTKAELAYIHGTADFFAVDPYTAQFASFPVNGVDSCAANTTDKDWPICVQLTNLDANGWLMGAPSAAYAYITPTYFRAALNYYNSVLKPKGGIFVTEFGFNPAFEAEMTLDKQRFDLLRTTYYEQFLTEMLKAIHSDGVKVIGALAWSIMDNNEFGDYSQHYGLQAVNRTTLVRTYKRSFFDFVEFIRTRP